MSAVGDGVSLEPKEFRAPPKTRFDQQPERAIRRFELITLMLQFLYTPGDGLQLAAVLKDVDAHLGRFVQDIAFSRKVRDQNTPGVSRDLRIYVFVRGRITHNRADVNASLVIKRAPSHKRHSFPRRPPH